MRSMSLRTKFILTLLFTSLSAIALVGFVAHLSVLRRFDDLVAKDAAVNFRNDVAAYIGQYGSWEAAKAAEPFPSFARRRGESKGLPSPLNLPRTGRPNLPPPPPEAGPFDQIGDDRPEPPRGAAPEGPPPAPTAGPKPLGAGLARAPFRFLLYDAQDRILMAVSPYKVGDTIRPEDKRNSVAVEVQGKVVAFASPQGHANYSDLDFGYLAAMREALFYGLGAAALFTLILGFLFGTRLSRNLRTLTGALAGLEQGQLGAQVKIQSRDEVGELAQGFNRMSAELASNHAALGSVDIQSSQMTVATSSTKEAKRAASLS